MAKKKTSNSSSQADIGLVGLAVMGQNLVLNMADHGYTVSVYNRTTLRMTDFIDYCKNNEPSADRVLGYKQLKSFVKSIKKPRKIVILVKAGRGTDAVIDQLTPLVDKGDVIIDGGNAEWTDTIRREADLKKKGIFFIGSGVSGGETGARFGPSLMPGGDAKAWKMLKPVWQAVAAKVDPKTGKPYEDYAPGKPVTKGEPCTTHIGTDGAGHYVKMVHNGIEYIDMQLICEAYNFMRTLLKMNPKQISDTFAKWNTGDLDSFLVQITADVLKQKDPRNKRKYFVDVVVDAAGQKGTGKWTAINALDMGIPANAIAEAVFARCISALKDERVNASSQLRGPRKKFTGNKSQALKAIRDALYCSKICAYAQGFQLMAEAQKEYNWKLDFGEIARIWRGGCIIRARFLNKITEAFRNDPKLVNLMLAPYFKKAIHSSQDNWRKIVSLSAEHGIPSPAFSSALAYYDGYRSKVVPANLLQAQRDFFGAHTYERTDEPRGKHFHIDWPEPGRPELKA